jgi:hypothetical protein
LKLRLFAGSPNQLISHCFGEVFSRIEMRSTGILPDSGLKSACPHLQGQAVTDELKRTVRIVRSKVATDDRGQTVWVEPIETAELELVTTGMLKVILESDDEERKQQLREIADSKDGVLAHDPDLDRFEIIDDSDLQTFLDSEAAMAGSTKTADVTLEPLSRMTEAGDDELSLVSTLVLRRIVGDKESSSDADEEIADSGFDPYDSA